MAARKRQFRVLWLNTYSGRQQRTTERIAPDAGNAAVALRVEVARRHNLMVDAPQILEIEEVA